MVNFWKYTTIGLIGLSSFLAFWLLGATGKINDFGDDCNYQLSRANSCWTDFCFPEFSKQGLMEEDKSQYFYDVNTKTCSCFYNNQSILNVKFGE